MSFACVLHFAMSSSAFHLHVFQNLHPFGFPWFSLFSVLSPTTLACACCTSQFLFREREKNILGMGRELTSGLGISPVDHLSNIVPFGGRLMPQWLTVLTAGPLLFPAHPLFTTVHEPIQTPSMLSAVRSRSCGRKPLPIWTLLAPSTYLYVPLPQNLG